MRNIDMYASTADAIRAYKEIAPEDSSIIPFYKWLYSGSNRRRKKDSLFEESKAEKQIKGLGERDVNGIVVEVLVEGGWKAISIETDSSVCILENLCATKGGTKAMRDWDRADVGYGFFKAYPSAKYQRKEECEKLLQTLTRKWRKRNVTFRGRISEKAKHFIVEHPNVEIALPIPKENKTKKTKVSG